MPNSDDLARRAAQRLDDELQLNLPAAVEAQLHAGKPPERFEPVTIAIALASLIVSASKAAWDIYHDVKADRQERPAPEVAARRLRLELTLDANLSAAQRDQVIAAVLAEMDSVSAQR
jgi:hypothetical protein